MNIKNKLLMLIACFTPIISFFSRLFPKKQKLSKKIEEALKAQKKLMSRFGLTTEEHFVCELLFILFEGHNVDPIASYYGLNVKKSGLHKVLLSLQAKGVILKSCKIMPYGPIDFDKLRFTENFLKYYRRTSREFGMELLEAYPDEAIIEGEAEQLKDFSGRYENENEFFYAYGKAIGWNQHIHKEVLRLIQWSKDNDHFGLDMNIAAFVVNKMWDCIHDHKLRAKFGTTGNNQY